MTVLVTGGTGMIGSQVLRQLVAAGRRTVAFTRRPPEPPEAVAGVTYIRADITAPAPIVEHASRNDCEGIIHLAALRDDECAADPEAAVAVNVEGTLSVLRAARDAGLRRVVFGSSIAVYGGGDAVFAEDMLPRAPVRLYGQTKALGEALAERFRVLHGVDVLCLRYGSIYGPGGPATRIGRSAQRNALLRTMWGEAVTIEEASGEERFQFTYSKDAAAATIHAFGRTDLQHAVYNVSGPPEDWLSLKEFCHRLREVAPRAGDVRFTGRGRGSMRVSIDRMTRELGYVPRYPLEAALRDTLASGL